MGAAASQQFVAGLELDRLLEVGQELVVLDDVLAAVEVPPAELVVRGLEFRRDGLEVGVREFIAAEVEAAGSGHLVDGADRQVDAAVGDLYRFVHLVIDEFGEGMVGGHIGRYDGSERKK